MTRTGTRESAVLRRPAGRAGCSPRPHRPVAQDDDRLAIRRPAAALRYLPYRSGQLDPDWHGAAGRAAVAELAGGVVAPVVVGAGGQQRSEPCQEDVSAVTRAVRGRPVTGVGVGLLAVEPLPVRLRHRCRRRIPCLPSRTANAFAHQWPAPHHSVAAARPQLQQPRQAQITRSVQPPAPGMAVRVDRQGAIERHRIGQGNDLTPGGKSTLTARVLYGAVWPSPSSP